MINTLFSMHDIKYIISVDDCFALLNREDMQAAILSQMIESLSPFEEFLSSSSQKEKLEEIRSLVALEADVAPALSILLNGLSYSEVSQCYALCDESVKAFFTEREGITAFLQGLKDHGTIQDYRTISSTNEAQKFNLHSSGMDDGAILWLLDRNFSRVGESPEAGLSFAENLIESSSAFPNYVYILSALGSDSDKTEDAIEEEFDAMLSSHCSIEAQSFIYFINKQRVLRNNTDKIAKSLSQGFKRKACFELFSLIIQCSKEASNCATETIKSVRQKTLNYLFSQKVNSNGESYVDFAARFVQIFIEEEYNRILGVRHHEISEKTRYYEDLCKKVAEQTDNSPELASVIKHYRDIELYNRHINAQQCEITTGDIFEIESVPYLLISQSCDTYLRKDGNRKLSHAVLLEITDNNKTEYSYPLSCFMEMSYPAVLFQSVKIIPFEILDLCAFNINGEAILETADNHSFENELRGFTQNYQARFQKVLDSLRQIRKEKDLLLAYFANTSDVSIENAQNAYNKLESVEPSVKNYILDGTIIKYPVKRLYRLKELVAVDIAEKYGTTLSRIGHPFDYSAKHSASNL